MIETLCNVATAKRPKLRICEVHTGTDTGTIVSYQDRRGVWSNRHGHSRLTVTIPNEQVFGVHGNNPYLTDGEKRAMAWEIHCADENASLVATVRGAIRRRYGVTDVYLDRLVVEQAEQIQQTIAEWC